MSSSIARQELVCNIIQEKNGNIISSQNFEIKSIYVRYDMYDNDYTILLIVKCYVDFDEQLQRHIFNHSDNTSNIYNGTLLFKAFKDEVEMCLYGIPNNRVQATIYEEI